MSDYRVWKCFRLKHYIIRNKYLLRMKYSIFIKTLNSQITSIKEDVTL